MEEIDKVVIAFDVDGTLRRPGGNESRPEAQEWVRTLMLILSNMKNAEIVLWSGGGELYARQIGHELHVDHFVTRYAVKGAIPVDLTIDDEDCRLGRLNLKL